MRLLSSALLATCLLGKLCLSELYNNLPSIDFRDTKTINLGRIPGTIDSALLPPGNYWNAELDIIYKVYTAPPFFAEQPPDASSNSNPSVLTYQEASNYGWALVRQRYMYRGKKWLAIGERWFAQARIADGKWYVFNEKGETRERFVDKAFVVAGRKAVGKETRALRKNVLSTALPLEAGLPNEAANAKFLWVERAVHSLFQEGLCALLFDEEAG
ncbi:MAG: hypothetical protein M1829_004830 [Trizodia sp. TS-e1964]|nr:MAG: hypothetical protein M1829_004830 [Trizodia sp. TS-e1964]